MLSSAAIAAKQITQAPMKSPAQRRTHDCDSVAALERPLAERLGGWRLSVGTRSVIMDLDLERDARIWQRRNMIKRGAAFATALFVVPGAFADELVKTPKQTEGPFYPDKLPL